MVGDSTKPRRARRWLRRLLIATLVVTLVGWLISGALAARMLTSRPRPRYDEPVPAQLQTSLGIESLRLKTRDGQEIGAWLYRGQPEKPIVIVLHGIADSRHSQGGLMRLFAREGNGVLALSMRAHGDSTGETCDFGWGARNDVVAAVDYLEQTTPHRPIVIFGASMGAAAAIFAAKDLGHRVAGYMLEAPYATLTKAAWIRVTQFLQPPLSYIAYAALRLWAPAYLPVSIGEISPARHIADIGRETPVLLIGGGRDVEAPAEDVAMMAEGRGAQTQVVIFPNARHVQSWASDPQKYEEIIIKFVGAADR